jgi:exopolysaccharide production protein ExoQ
MSRIMMIVCLGVIAFLLWRDSKKTRNVSVVIWLPQIWLFILATRSVAEWTHLGTPLTSTLTTIQEGNSLDRNFFLILMIVGMVILVKRNCNLSNFISHNLLIFFFLVYCLISIIWSDYPLVSTKRYVRLIGMMTMILLVLTEEDPKEAVKTLLRRSMYLFLPLSVLFIRYFPDLGRYYNRWTYQVTYCAICTDKNALGGIALIGGVYYVWNLLTLFNARRLTLKSPDVWIDIVLLAVDLYLLRMAQSSTSTACFLIGTSILCFINLPFIKKAPNSAGKWITIIGVTLIILQMVFDLKGMAIHALGRSDDFTDRVPLWNILLGMKTNPIFGTGYESFWTVDRMSYLETVGREANQSHNGYLDVYLNLGLIGDLFFILFFISGYLRHVKSLQFEFSLNQFKTSHIILFMFFNFTEAVFPRLSFQLFVYYLLLIEVPPRINPEIEKKEMIELEKPERSQQKDMH